MAIDLQSTDRGNSLKMVAATGNAPVYSAFQANANLSQLSSLFLKFIVFGGYTRKLHATCITNPYA